MDWRGLPLLLAATLASGLPEDSRCRRRLSGARVPTDTMLLATIADQLALLLWRYAAQGTPKPESILDTLLRDKPKAKPFKVFRSGAEFDAALAKFMT